MRFSARRSIYVFLKSYLLSIRTKTFPLLLLIVLSILSGQIPILNDYSKQGRTFNEVEALSAVAFAESDSDYFSEFTSQGDSQSTISQFKQVAIGQALAPSPKSQIAKDSDNDSDDDWGEIKKVSEHTYTIKVEDDEKMAGASEILNALNDYRKRHGRGELAWDGTLAGFAQQRAESFKNNNGLDAHAGFNDYLNNQDGFKKLGFMSLGENSSYGFTLEATHLIEWVYGKSEGHNTNQLNSDWGFVGIGVSGNATNLVFGGQRM